MLIGLLVLFNLPCKKKTFIVTHIHTQTHIRTPKHLVEADDRGMIGSEKNKVGVGQLGHAHHHTPHDDAPRKQE